MDPLVDALDTFSGYISYSNIVTGARDDATGSLGETCAVDTVKQPPTQVASASFYLVNASQSAESPSNYSSVDPPSHYDRFHSSSLLSPSSPCSSSSLVYPLNGNTTSIIHMHAQLFSGLQYGRTPSGMALQKPRCWDHGCGGRTFSSLGNYRRHLREQNRWAPVFACPICGKLFTRSTARKLHREMDKCWATADFGPIASPVPAGFVTPQDPFAAARYPGMFIPSLSDVTMLEGKEAGGKE